jgi:NAD+ kinase
MKSIRTVEVFVNDTKEKAVVLGKAIKKELKKTKHKKTKHKKKKHKKTKYKLITAPSSPADLTIGLGGDGTLLKWLRDNDYYDSLANKKYIGINCGTLGFLQDFDLDINKIANFVSNIPNYLEEKVYFLDLYLETPNGYKLFHCLNEFNVLNNHDRSLRTKVKLKNKFLENFVGTSLLFCTPSGSTAQNIASVGSILYPGIEAFQMTPCEPIVNKEVRCLQNSICIPKNVKVTLLPVNSDKIKIIADGKNVYEGLFTKILVSYSSLYMTKLVNDENNFVEKIREKLI